MDKYYDLLLEGKFYIVEKEIKELLEKDNQNSELWYLLFLSSNNNYINLDKDNIKNEIVFNKAIEYATFSDEIKYSSEYYLYTNLFILPGFDKIFRLYQFKKYDEVNKLLNELNNSNYNVNINNKLLDSIKVILGNYSSTIEYKIQLKIYELLYKYSNNEKIFDIINNLKNDNYYNYLEIEEQKELSKPKIEDNHDNKENKDVSHQKKDVTDVATQKELIEKNIKINYWFFGILFLIIGIVSFVIFCVYESSGMYAATKSNYNNETAAAFPDLTTSNTIISIVIVLILLIVILINVFKKDFLKIVFDFFGIEPKFYRPYPVIIQFVHTIIVTIRALIFISEISGYKWNIIWPHLMMSVVFLFISYIDYLVTKNNIIE